MFIGREDKKKASEISKWKDTKIGFICRCKKGDQLSRKREEGKKYKSEEKNKNEMIKSGKKRMR